VNGRGAESFLQARDRFLKPGGALFPSSATLSVCPYTDATLHEEQVQGCWGVACVCVWAVLACAVSAASAVSSCVKRVLCCSSLHKPTSRGWVRQLSWMRDLFATSDWCGWMRGGRVHSRALLWACGVQRFKTDFWTTKDLYGLDVSCLGPEASADHFAVTVIGVFPVCFSPSYYYSLLLPEASKPTRVCPASCIVVSGLSVSCTTVSGLSVSCTTVSGTMSV
jgi:hypothetical protein